MSDDDDKQEFGKRRRLHTDRFEIRLSPSVRREWERMAQEAGLTLSDLIRTSMSKTRIVNRRDWQLRAYQLAKIGTNINQLASWANRYKGGADAQAIVMALNQVWLAIKDEFEPPAKSTDDYPETEGFFSP